MSEPRMPDGATGDDRGDRRDPARSLQEIAMEALEAGRFDLADQLLDSGEVTLAELTHNLRVQQTELELQAQELRESNVLLEHASRRFRQLFEALPQSALVTDRFGTVLSANREAERLLGLHGDRTRSVALPRLAADAAASSRIRGAFVLADREGAAEVREIEVQGADDAPLLVDIGIERLEEAEPGEGERFIVLVIDGTARRAEQEQVRLLAAAVATLEDIVLITDASPLDEPGPRIVFVNDAFERRSGYTRDEVLGRSPRLLEGPDTDRAELDRIRDALERRQSVSAELVNYDRDGRPYWLEIVIAPIVDRQGTCTHFVAVQRDVSDRRRTEERARQAQRLEALGQLTGGVAHDFNNLLSVILGYADELATDDALDLDRRQLAEIIRTAAERGADLTSRLLTFGRMQVLQPTSVDVNQRLSALLDTMLRRSIGEHVAIHLELDPGVGRVELDPGQFESAVVNLAVNARDALDRGGSVVIRTVERDLSTDEARPLEIAAGRYVVVEVSDDGEGIGTATLDQVFDPFFTTKPSGKGTGLGLAMVYGFVKQSSGAVAIESSEGVGTTVTMFLPRGQVRADDVEAIEPDRPARAGSDGALVLLVEDDPLVRSLSRSQLTSLGYQVVAAADGDEALASVAAEPGIALLFTDVLLPGGMDGKQLADAVHAQRPELPVLFTSGFTQHALSSDGRLAAGVRLLEKPYRRSDLAEAVAAALAGDPPPS